MNRMQLCAGVSLFALAACGGGGATNPTPNPNPTQTLSTIRVTNAAIPLDAGATATLTPEALDASGRVISGVTGYTYSSSASTVAESRSTGTVLGISAGTATITVTLVRDGVTATATSTVTVTGALPVAASVTAGNADQTFSPQTVVVARNANVTFTFGALLHNVVFRAATGAPTAVPNTTNASVARAFPTAGDFDYDCSLHAGMRGTVVVR